MDSPRVVTMTSAYCRSGASQRSLYSAEGRSPVSVKILFPSRMIEFSHGTTWSCSMSCCC